LSCRNAIGKGIQAKEEDKREVLHSSFFFLCLHSFAIRFAMSIKTLHITNAWHPASGGISTFYRALIETANRQGRPIRIVVPGEETRVEEIGPSARVYHIKAPRAPIFDRRYRLLLPHTYLRPFRGVLRRILQEEQPHIVEVCDKYSISWLSGLLRCGWLESGARPVLIGMNCERMDDNVAAFVAGGQAARRLVKSYLGNLYIPLFDYHIANSDYTADELRDAMAARHHRQIHVRPMGAEIETFSAAQATQTGRRALLSRFECDGSRPDSQQVRLLLYAGRLSPEKNIGLLVEALERLPEEYKLVVAGSGPLAGRFEDAANLRAPGRVRLLGHLGGRRELAEVYANCDAFLHPNPREPFGIAPLEAMAAGIPLIAPRSGGVLSFADETNAWLCEASAESFAGAARAVFADPAARKDRLARARWTARRYAWSDVAGQFFELYDELNRLFPASRFARQFQARVSSRSGHLARQEP
jgi:alpha-1,6-mannosyltransferase